MPTLLHKYARTEVVFGKTKVLCCTCALPVRTIGAEAYICSPNPQVAGNGQQVQQLTPQSVLLLDPAHPNYPIDQSPSQPKAPKQNTPKLSDYDTGSSSSLSPGCL